MQTITGLFDTYEHATAAVHALHEAGIAHADISIVANAEPDYEPDDVGEGATTGAEVGAGLGAAGGLLAGLGIIAIPGLGPVVAAGWLFATAIGAIAGAGVGAATGGLVGALTSAGVPEADATVLAESVRRGGSIVSARVDEAHAGPAVAILRHAEGIDIAQRRRDYEQEGWTGYDEEAPAEPSSKPENYPYVPPVV
ncbi:MAG: hypothetical protein JWQ89_1180 [Devosia sp.]|uniref:hypothetical protein n=1 Tax=Devosia sp. TaxID=1871048 RepID=UPI00261B223A|nr:hypothetical protein [Devosia sp.]MDB5539453.1 hypothetical protein [Devosia sp.]